MIPGRRNGLIALGLAALALLPGAADVGKNDPTAVARATKDWPVFRGNSLQTGVADAKLPERLDELWKFSTGDSIEGAAAVAGGVVYVGSLDENLYALDLAAGTQKWKYKAGPVRGAPAVRGDAVYVGSVDGLFTCVDAAKGTKKWSYEAQAEITGGANFAGTSVLFTSQDDTLYCLGPDGKERWKYKIDGPIYGSPTVAGGHTFVAGCDSMLHVVDLAKGKQVRSVELGGQSGVTPGVAGDTLYVGTMSNEFEAIDWKKGQVSWTFKAARRSRPFRSSAAVTDSLVVVGSQDRKVYALDRKKGTEVWNFPTQGQVDSSPVVAGGRVYVGSQDGRLYVLDLATGRQLQKVKLDGPVNSSPAVAAGRLLIGTNKGTLYCFGAKK